MLSRNSGTSPVGMTGIEIEVDDNAYYSTMASKK